MQAAEPVEATDRMLAQVSAPTDLTVLQFPKLRASTLAETAFSWVPSWSCVQCTSGWSPVGVRRLIARD